VKICELSRNCVVTDCFFRDKFKNRFIAQEAVDLFIIQITEF
jgi:hypothetical protein